MKSTEDLIQKRCGELIEAIDKLPVGHAHKEQMLRKVAWVSYICEQREFSEVQPMFIQPINMIRSVKS